MASWLAIVALLAWAILLGHQHAQLRWAYYGSAILLAIGGLFYRWWYARYSDIPDADLSDVITLAKMAAVIIGLGFVWSYINTTLGRSLLTAALDLAIFLLGMWLGSETRRRTV